MKKERECALCVIAHPDDETIWMGGAIMLNNKWNWTVLSLCRKGDPDRAPKFVKVCEIYKAEGIISDLDDEILRPLPVKKIVEKVKSVLSIHEYDFIFTHGENGEYGHIRHKEIHKAIKWMWKHGVLKCEKLFYFAYVSSGKEAFNNQGVKVPTADLNADWAVELDAKTLAKKKEIVVSVYGFPENGFEAMACGKKEAFVLAR